jgi:hypothetical protein
MMVELPDDLQSKRGYCIAYGEAARLAEMARFDHGWGKDFAAGIGGDAEAIEQEVKRRLGPGILPGLIKIAVADALDNPQPQW